MYVTLSDIQNGEPVSLDRTLSGRLEVALCELTYYHQWYNISAALGNNKVSGVLIPDGYYNSCELDEHVFRPLGAELHLHAPTGRLQLSARKERLVLNKNLAETFGFTRKVFEASKTHIADKPHRLAIHRELCVHLSEVSTSDNSYNGHPSTLFRSVPVENEKCGGGRTETFPILQYKRLISGAISQLTLSVLDVNGKKVELDYLSATLHIRNG